MKILSIFLLGAQFGNSAGQGTPVGKTRVTRLYTFQGCYEDRFDRAMPHQIGLMQKEECMEACVGLGYHYFALQYNMECFCSGLNDKNDRGFAKYGKASTGCSCDSKSQVGGYRNCVYRAWPEQTTSYLPETACMTPAKEEEGAEIDVGYCGNGGLNVYYYTNKNEVKHRSNLCVEMKVENNKMKLVLETCSGKDNQKFEVLNDCVNGVCGDAIGSGFSAECPTEKDECMDAKIFNYDVLASSAQINVYHCNHIRALDSSAPSGQYNFNGHDGDYTFCDYNSDRRIKSQLNSNYCLNWLGNALVTLQPCTTLATHNKFGVRSNGIVKPYGINIDQCFYVDSYGSGQPVKQGPCLNIQHGIKFEWYIDNFGQIKPKGAPHMCLEVLGGYPIPGAQIVIWGCHGGLNQRWLF